MALILSGILPRQTHELRVGVRHLFENFLHFHGGGYFLYGRAILEHYVSSRRITDPEPPKGSLDLLVVTINQLFIFLFDIIIGFKNLSVYLYALMLVGNPYLLFLPFLN